MEKLNKPIDKVVCPICENVYMRPVSMNMPIFDSEMIERRNMSLLYKNKETIKDVTLICDGCRSTLILAPIEKITFSMVG